MRKNVARSGGMKKAARVKRREEKSGGGYGERVRGKQSAGGDQACGKSGNKALAWASDPMHICFFASGSVAARECIPREPRIPAFLLLRFLSEQ